jgi:hypothetical protein
VKQFFIIFILLFSGCAVKRETIKIETQIINVPATTVVLFGSYDELFDEYRRLGGKKGYRGIGMVGPNLGEGFYMDGIIYCVKWNLKICGEELFHFLRDKGSPPLEIDLGFEHWK